VEIVELCVEGLTNEQIAHRLNLSIGTVNTYWLRIKLKVGGLGKTDTVVKVIQERADQALADANLGQMHLAEMIAESEKKLLEYRAALALLQLALNEIKSAVWATGPDLTIQIVASGEYPSTHAGVKWETGKTVYEIFKTTDDAHPAIAAHLGALNGQETAARLTGEFDNMLVRVKPLFDDADEVIGCISILSSAA
jgi:hypothetical protein